MPETIERLRFIRRQHDFYNRSLTFFLALLVCATGCVLWLAGVPLEQEYKKGVGLAVMLLAFVFYKIPYLSYRLTRSRFSSDRETLRLMGDDWRQYKLRILNQPLY